PTRKHLHHPRDLAQPDDLAVRDVGHVRLPEEGQHVVLTQAVELDLAHHDHVAGAFGVEHPLPHDVLDAHPVAAREPPQRSRHAVRRPQQALAIGIFAEQLELPPCDPFELVCFVRHAASALLFVDAPRPPSYAWPMLLVGLTGNIASGKSTVAQLLSEHGATIIDADVLARRAVEVGTPGYDKIVQRWGHAVLTEDGRLDRA